MIVTLLKAAVIRLVKPFKEEETPSIEELFNSHLDAHEEIDLTGSVFFDDNSFTSGDSQL